MFSATSAIFRRKFPSILSWSYCTKSETSSLWYPSYLHEAKSKFPEYPLTNIQIKGYDYVVLEKFQKKIHWLCKRMDIEVTDCWAQECKKLKILRFKPKTSIAEAEYILKLYERNVQVDGVYGYQMGTLIDLIITLCPPGVTISLHPHEDSHTEARYVPDYKLLELQKMLASVGENN